MNGEIDHKKIELIQWITSVEDTDIIKDLLALRRQSTISNNTGISEGERMSIEKGMEDSKKGNLVPNSEAKKIYGEHL